MSEIYTLTEKEEYKCLKCGSTNILLGESIIPDQNVLIKPIPNRKVIGCIDCAKNEYDVHGAIIFRRIVNGETIRGEVLLNKAQYELLKDFSPTNNGAIIGIAVTNQVLPKQMFKS